MKRRTNHSYKLGDLVAIPDSGFKKGKIVEFRGALAPGGRLVYRVIVRRKPTPAYIELTEDQIKPIERTGNGTPKAR